MGIICTRSKVHVTTTQHVVPVLFAPMRLNRNDAEKLLVSSQIGSYVFSYDITSECFVSVSAGEYVCHHAIAKNGTILIVGGERFTSINDAIQHYKTHPLGSIKLTKQYSIDNPHRPVLKKTISQPSSMKRRSLIQKTVVEQQNEGDIFYNWKNNRSVAFKSPTPSKPRYKEKEEDEEELLVAAVNKKNKEKKEKDHLRVSVSSGDFQESGSYIDEPIPILPAPTGTRPPPLFPRFSNLAGELSEAYMSSTSYPTDLKQTLFQLYKGNPRLKYSQRVDVVKIIVVGQTDTYELREYMAEHLTSVIQQFAINQNIYCEYVDFMLCYTKSEIDNDVTDMVTHRTLTEMKHCEHYGIPFILLVELSEETPHIIIPNSFSDNEFGYLLKHLSSEQQTILQTMVFKDYNSTPPRLAVDDGVKKDIMEIILSNKEMMREDNFLSIFNLDIKEIIEEAQCYEMLTNILIIEKQTETMKQENILNEYLENFFIQLREEELIKEELYVQIPYDERKIKKYFEENFKVAAEKIKFCLFSNKNLMKERTVSDLDYDEVLYHLLTSARIAKETSLDFTFLNQLKNYLQGETTHPMIVVGSKWSGKTTVLCHIPQLASDVFADSCIVCRLIGHTIDSCSLQLLLKSICLQLSYAYSTDPFAVPQTTESLVQFFQSLFDLPTDSLPLIIILDSLDALKTDDGINPLDIIPTTLPNHVKIIVSLNSLDSKKTSPNDYAKLTLPTFTSYRALESLDRLLVKRERTLNSKQKDIVANLIEKQPEPIYVKLIVTELASWKSTDLKEDVPSSVSDWLNYVCQQIPVHENIMAAFVYALTIDSLGISTEILVEFLREMTQIMCYVKIQCQLRTMLQAFENFVEYCVIAGHLFLRTKGKKVLELLRQKYSPETDSNFASLLKSVISRNLQHKFLIEDLNDEQKIERFSKCQSLFSHFQQLSCYLHTSDEMKSLFFYNYSYLSHRLKHLSLTHVLHDLKNALIKFPNDHELLVLMDFLDLAVSALNHDPDQLPLQITCRLDINDQQNMFINHFIEAAKTSGYPLTPKQPCLIIPERLCDLTKAKQYDWHTKDLKPLFLLADDYSFITYSAQREEIYFYDQLKELKEVKFVRNLQRIILATKRKLVVEIKQINTPTSMSPNQSENGVSMTSYTSRLDVYDVILKEWSTISHPELLTENFFATDHEHTIISLNKTQTRLSMVDLRSLDIVWQYEASNNFQNVVICKDGSIAVCFLDKGNEDEEILSASSDLQNNLLHVKEINDYVTDEFTDLNNATTSGSESHDGDSVVINENKNNGEEILILDLKNKTPPKYLTINYDLYYGKLFAITEDGQYFVQVSDYDKSILVWNLHNGNLVHTITTHCWRLSRLAVSSKGDCIVTVSSDSIIWVFNLSDGILRHQLTEPVRAFRSGYVNDNRLSLSDDGVIAIHHVRSNYNVSYFIVWNIQTGTRLASLTTDFYDLTYHLSPSGDYVISNFPSGLAVFDINR